MVHQPAAVTVAGARPQRDWHEQQSLVGRYYDPGTGQFLTVDPMVQETGQPYAYTGDNPVNQIDPNGLDIFLTVSPTTARFVGEFLNGAQFTLQVLDSRLGVVGAAAVAALDYVSRLLGISDPGDPLIEGANEADIAVAKSGRNQASQGIVVIDIQTVSFFGFDTKIPTGGYSASGTSRKGKGTSKGVADISGCATEGVYV